MSIWQDTAMARRRKPKQKLKEGQVQGLKYFDQARDLVATQSGRIRDKSFRDYYLNHTWPAREIVAEDRRTFGH